MHSPELVGGCPVTAEKQEHKIVFFRTLQEIDAGRLRIEQTLIAPNYKLRFSDPKTEHGRRTIELDHFHPAFGLRFREISEKDQARIDSFVAERERAGFRG